MANDAGQSQPDLTGRDQLPMTGIDFFQLLRRLETEALVFGGSGGPSREPARLGQQIRQNFAVQDVASFQASTDKLPAKVRLMNFGLLGPEGPMPLHITRWALDRLSQRWFSGGAQGATSDTTFVDFCDMLQHRIIALFYRAWADTRPEVQVNREGGGRSQSMLGALSGVELTESAEMTAVRLQQVAALAHQVHGPERLTRFLSQAIQVPVKLIEYIGNWVEIPQRLQTKLGEAHCKLGSGATAGSRTFQRQNKFELQIGPLDFGQFIELLPGGKKLRLLRESILAVNGHEMDADVRLILHRAAIPEAKIGQALLSRTAWIAPRRQSDANDLRISQIVGPDSLYQEAVA